MQSFSEITGVTGHCGALRVFLGFAQSDFLRRVSFADILDEETGDGYQRPRNRKHSLDFRNYIQKPNTSTIPLTFNLRPDCKKAWRITGEKQGRTVLAINPKIPCMAQIDCQHRLGELQELNTSLAFMTFLGLDLRTEMAMFVTINSKAKGLSSSLTDFHESNLLTDLAIEAPHLYIARKLNEDSQSPWCRRIRYGGETSSGLQRVTSFRMMQKTVSRFLSQTNGAAPAELEGKYSLISSYWCAVKSVFNEEWANHRQHLITKGLGLYALTYLLADFVNENPGATFDERFFIKLLTPLKGKVKWGSKEEFAGIGGQKGAKEIYNILKERISE